MVDIQKKQTTGHLIDFNRVDETYGVDDMIDAYMKGKIVGEKKLEEKIKKEILQGLQTSAMSSSLFKEKLKNLDVEIVGMYLRIIDLNTYECLAIIKDKDFYEKNKRWNSYEVAKNVNQGIDNVELNFSLMPASDKIEYHAITSDGFYYKYNGSK